MAKLFTMSIAKPIPLLSPHRRQQPDSDKLQLVLRVAELAAAVARNTKADGETTTAVPGLTLLRLSAPCEPVHMLHRPALCLIVQGVKHMHLADELYAYDASAYLIVAQHLPVMGRVVQASPQEPYLCLRLDFDPLVLAEHTLAHASTLAMTRHHEANDIGTRGLFVGNADLALIDAMLRLVKLTETPHDIAALAPLVVQEIIYRLITSETGWRLAQLGQEDAYARRIALAIQVLRERFTEPLRLADLARAAHMSTSSLHHHFKAVTAMSPLQYQKRLRLYEARKLLLAGATDAAAAAHQVGYNSASQFSREYARLFGAPPARDLRAMREHNR
jgi:AraC-like DNA-binding protein